MILRTKTDESTGAIKSIGLFGKSLSELKTIFSSIKSNGIINTFFNTSTIDTEAIREYNTEIEKAIAKDATMAEKQQIMKTAMEGTNKATAQLISTTKGATVSTEALTTAQKQSTIASKAATVATKALSVALNMVAFFVITEAISAVVSWLKSYTDAVANAKEGSEVLTQKMKDFDSTVGENSKTLSSLNGKYQELSKGVNKLGENISLSSSEYEEYKDIVQQVSEIMPDLSVRFNSQGEAIGFTDGKLKDLTKTYEEYRKKTAQGFLSNGDGEGHTVKDIVANYKNQSDRAWYDNFGEKAKNFLIGSDWIGHVSGSDTLTGKIFHTLGGTNNPIVKGVTSFFGIDPSLEEYLEELGKSNREKKKFYESLQKLSKENFGDITEFTNILGYDIKDISKMNDKDFSEFKKILQQEADKYGNEIEAAADAMKQVISEKLASSDEYYKLSEKARNNISSLLSGLNDELLQELNINDEIDAGNFAETLMNQFSDNDSFSKAWNQLFGKGIDKLPVNEYVSKVNSIIDTIGNSIGLTTNDQKNKLLTALGFDNLDELVNDYNGAIKSAAEKWKLDDRQKDDLEKFFTENSINTEEEIDTWKEIAAEAENATEAKRNYLSVNAVDNTKQQLEALQKTYDAISEEVQSLTTALSESVSGAGLSSDSVAAVNEMFGRVKGYDPEKLLDKTANGIRLNTRELEKLKKEYDDNTAKEFYKTVEDAYNSWQTALRNGEEQSVTDELYNQYEQAAQLADQYVGLTSAYNQWQNALSTANEGDMYDSMQGQIKAMEKLWAEGRTNVDEFRAFADLISSKDLSGASQAEVEKAYANSIGKIKRYFMEGEQGLENFLQDVNKVNSEWAHMKKDGTWEFDFGVGGDKDVAKALGIDVEALQIILRKMSEYDESINIDFDFDSVAMMGKEADKAYAKLKKLGKTNYKFKFDTGDIAEVNKQITKAEKVLDKFRDKDGNIDLSIEGAAEAQSMLIKLMTEKQELEKPAILQVDTKELSGKAASVVTMLQKIQQDINTYDVQVAVGADTTEAEKKINSDIEAIKANYGDELANIHINLDNIDSARQELSTLTQENIDVMVNAIVNHKEVDEYKKEKEEKKLKVITEVDDKAVNSFMGKTLEKTIKAKVEVDDSELDKVNTKKSKSTDKKKSDSKSNTTEKSTDKKAKVNGTFNTLKDTLASRGFANASGNISIPKNQTALVNELGEELIVRDGRWFTVKGGAQFTELKKGDIIFNHMQTRQLLKNGKITSSNNRGKFAHSKGTFGNAFSNGLVNFKRYKDSTPKKDSKKSSQKSSKSKKSSKNSSSKKESKQLIDWIARKLDVLQEKIDLTKTKFENLFTVKKKQNNLDNQIKKTTNLLNKEEKAATKYQKKANSIKLSDSLKNNVKNGKIKGSLSELIKEYGEKTANQISKYQDYIDKVNEAKKAVAELKAEIKELTKQKLEVKLDDNERKLTYQEAKYANAKTASAKNKILNKEISTYKSDYKAYQTYYKDAKKLRNQSGKEAKSAVNNTKGLSKSVKSKIKNLIKKGKEIPSNLLKKVEKVSKSAHKKLIDYNNNVDFAADALRDKNLAKEEKETNVREAKIEKKQNLADQAEAKYNLNKQYEANATDAKTKNDYEAKSLKNLKSQYGYLIEIAKLEGDTTEQKRLQAELDEKTAESYKTMYGNIKTEYENETGLNDANIAVVQAQIATLEAAGRTATKEMYDNMMKVTADTKKKLLEERAKLEESGKNFAYGSQDWYEWQNDLLSIDQQLESCTQQSIEFQKAINELDLKKFSLITAQLESANNQIDFLADMLSHKELTSKDSVGITDEGFTTISLWMDKMKNNSKIIENAQNAMAEYQKQMAEGTTGDSFEVQNQKLQEWVETIRDAKLANEEFKDSIVGLIEDAFKIQLDVLNELIEKRKKALQNERDLYSYQLKVAKQTKNIALIEKQIAALTGDKSEEARTRLQKLNVELDEAQQDLKDTEYDKWLSDREDMLDGLADEMEDFFENIMHDTNGLIAAVEKAINENGTVIVNTLEELGLGDSHSFDTKDNGDDTYTQDYMDYDGNTVEVTYDKIGNTVKVSYPSSTPPHDDTDDPMKDSGGVHSEAFMSYPKEKIAGEIYAEEQAKKEKELQIKWSLNKRKSLKNQSTSYINKYTTGEYGNVLNQYLANKDGKVYTSWADMKELADIFGIKVSGKKVTSKEAKKIRDALKDSGFSEGGIVSEINKAIKENGDDGIGTLKKGEAVLTPKQTEAIQNVSERFVKVGSGLTPEQEEYIKQNIIFSRTATNVMDDMTKAVQTMEINNNKNVRTTKVDVGGVTVNLEGSHVVDMDSMFQQLQQPRNKQRMTECVIGQVTNPLGNVLSRF